MSLINVIEDKVNSKLRKYPKVKKIIKRIYQFMFYLISPKIKKEGDIIRVTPKDNYEYFFGYYDKSPWNVSEDYMICLRAKCTYKEVSPKEEAEIVLIDVKNNNKIEIIGKTSTWNVQQGCMLQWLGPNYDNTIIYNDCIDDKYVSIIYNIESKSKKIINMPVYSVSSDGKFALSLDFSRLYNLRPGYGYYNIKEETENEKCPDKPCIYKIDLENNVTTPIMKYTDLLKIDYKEEFKNAVHKVNHIMISPNGKRFMFLHRWFNGDKKTTRLITVDIDGNNVYNLLDEDMISHSCWKNDDEILSWAHTNKYGNKYYLLKDKTQERIVCWDKDLMYDGHPTFSPNGKYAITDCYPDRQRLAHIYLMNEDNVKELAKVFAPFKYDNDTRCDLHPRWDRKSEKICFDSVFEGKRGLYIVDISKFVPKKSETIIGKSEDSNKKKIVFLITSCKKSGPIQQTLNIIKNLDTDYFYPILITIYEEGVDSRISDYLPYVQEHYLYKTSKKKILFNKNNDFKEFIKKINPDIIHSVGVFPDYLVSKINFENHIFTLRNYIYEDYIAKFGKIRGIILAKLQLKAIKNTKKVVTCSKSLAKIYKEKLNLKFDYICNGVDISKYIPVKNMEEKILIRNEIGIPKEAFVFAYSGQFITRKNIPFLLKNFSEVYKNDNTTYLILLGNGTLLDELKNEYNKFNNIVFYGNVDNVNYYLKAADVYVSTSKSEGLPNGVLEAMAAKLPVLLSDIEQHKEIFETGNNIGEIYSLNNDNEFKDKLEILRKTDINIISENSLNVVKNNYTDVIMSKKYQEVYKNIIEKEK